MSDEAMHGSEEMVAPASVVTETSGGAPRFVVGIGASAGGLDPLVRFFDNLPKATGMAFVIVQHLFPDFKSLMDELLARHTLLPIHLVEDGMRVEAGGLVIAQDLESAQFDGMPRSTIDTGVVQHTLLPEEMPRVLLDHARQHSATVPQAAEQEPPQPAGVDALYRILETEFGIDFNHYKPSTVTRRIERRLSLAHSQNIDDYLARLHSERDELDALYRDLLIGVTRFFRDPDAFDLLEQRILPDLLTREPRATPVRLWVAGCATGEEAYSLAIVLQDLMAIHGERPVKFCHRRVARAGRDRGLRGGRRLERPAGAAVSLFHSERQHLPGCARAATDDRLRAAQRDQRRTVYETRSRHVPEPAHLPAAARAAAHPLTVPLRSESGRRAHARSIGNPRTGG